MGNHEWMLVLGSAFIASTVAAIAGTGGGIILLPVLGAVFGVRDAVPIYTVAQLIGNLSRVGFNRREVDGKVVCWFAIGAVPCGLLGAWIFTRIPDAGLSRLLGIFLMLCVLIRRCFPHMVSKLKAWHFGPVGAVFSVISATVGSAGPFLAPFYLSYGLTKGAFIGTEAMGTALMHIAKLVSYESFGVMNSDMWFSGIAIGPAMIAGTYVGKKFLAAIPANRFILLIDSAILGFGAFFLIR